MFYQGSGFPEATTTYYDFQFFLPASFWMFVNGLFLMFLGVGTKTDDLYWWGAFFCCLGTYFLVSFFTFLFVCVNHHLWCQSELFSLLQMLGVYFLLPYYLFNVASTYQMFAHMWIDVFKTLPIIWFGPFILFQVFNLIKELLNSKQQMKQPEPVHITIQQQRAYLNNSELYSEERVQARLAQLQKQKHKELES